jgi:TolA-binding protein
METPAVPAPLGSRVVPGSPIEEPAPAPREMSGSLVPMPSGNSTFPPPLVAPPSLGREEAAPMPREQTPPPPRLPLLNLLQPAPTAEVNTLHQETERLHMECEAMLHDEMELQTEKDLKGSKGEDTAQLRKRITDLVTRAAAQQANGRRQPAAPEHQATNTAPPQPAGPKRSPDQSAPPKSADGDHAPPHPFVPVKPTTPTPPTVKQPDNSAHLLTDAPVDPQSLAMALFLTGEYESALNAYRKLEQEEQKIEDRIAIQYMIACCLRKMGKLEEAAALYREVANSGGNEILVENSQWYLKAMKERSELETQLGELKQRRQTVGPKKP